MKNPARISLVLTDVDGTMVTPDKRITDRTQAVVRKLTEAGITFAITSGRPPRGMRMVVEALGVRTPIAAFNGGMFVNPDLSPIAVKEIPPDCVPTVIRALIARGLDPWVYQGNDWLVRNLDGPRVAREQEVVQFAPKVVDDLERYCEGVVKIVGVSLDTELVERVELEARERFGDRISAARSHSSYLDFTHPDANKGAVCRWWAEKLGLAREQIATIGDMPNDVLMFAHSGLSISMGQSSEEVKRATRRVTKANTDEGFAEAMERWVLGGAEPGGV